MNDRKRKRKGPSDVQASDPWKPTNDEAEVAKYLLHNLPSTEGRLSGTTVRTFIAKDAVDLLMGSAWARVPNPSTDSAGRGTKRNRLFTSHASVIDFLNQMLAKQMFHRAVVLKKVKVTSSATKRSPEGKPVKTVKSKKSVDSKPVDPGDMSSKAQDALGVKDSELTETVGTQPPQPTTTTTMTTTTTSSPTLSVKSNSTGCGTSKSAKKPPRLELHPEQALVTTDEDSVYVWIYEPPPSLFNWLAGSGLILAIIFCCLFPIWPAPLRRGTYYLTLLASGLFGLLMAVALVRLLVYAVCWLISLGGYSLWLFPNFFADCGFFESFRPVVSFTPIVVSTGKKGKASGARKARVKGGADPPPPAVKETVVCDGVEKELDGKDGDGCVVHRIAGQHPPSETAPPLADALSQPSCPSSD